MMEQKTLRLVNAMRWCVSWLFTLTPCVSPAQLDTSTYARVVHLSGQGDVRGLMAEAAALERHTSPQDHYLATLARAMADFRSDRMVPCAQQLDSLRRAEPPPDPRLLAVMHKFQAGVHERAGDHGSGLQEIDAGLVLADSVRLPMERVDLLVMKAEFLFADELNDEAMSLLHAAQRLAERTNYARGLCMVRINMGNFRYGQERWQEAWADYRSALNLATAGGFELLAENCANNIGAVAASTGKYDIALHLFDSLLNTLGEQRRSFKAVLMGQVGYIRDMKGDHAGALPLFQRAMALSDSLGDARAAADTRQYLSSALWEMGRKQEAIAERRKVLDAMIAAGDGHMEVETRWILWELYEAIGDKDAALHEARVMSLLDDSLEHARYNDRLALNEVRFETERKEHRLREQQQALLLAGAEESRKRTQRDLAIAIACAVALLAFFLIDRRRRRARHEQQQAVLKERLRIADDLHDDLGAGLSTLRLRGELALRRVSDPEQRRALEDFSSLANELTQNMRGILWAIGTEQTSLRHLVEHVTSQSREFLSGSGVSVNIEVGELPEREVSAEVRRNLSLVMKEVLNNVLKHARAANVYITITWNDALIIAVRDDGIGMAEVAEGRGQGSRTIRQRVEALGGKAVCERPAEGGTAWRFSIPLPDGNERSIGMR